MSDLLQDDLMCTGTGKK